MRAGWIGSGRCEGEAGLWSLEESRNGKEKLVKGGPVHTLGPVKLVTT
jgi:hypothetical protein